MVKEIKKLTLNNRLIIDFFNRGYYINDCGSVFNPKNKEIGFIKVNGYKSVALRENKIRVSIMVHRIQAFKKYGYEIFSEGIVVRHLNGIPTDNSINNIAIGTHSDNMNDMPVTIRRSKASKAGKIHDHKSIILDRNKGMTYKELMRKYNISSKGTISFIINKSMTNETNPAT
jgi:hypothetical protein